ncbi:uncharacterized protein LOC135202054 isoform X1 [Macrobrachium nipponense]|uniref:uncharacterized protein LOC135202054 isoform X1 n=1 Tax=Macrobrachium nipponense TaxID=159736 RepID=UPI0030C8800B
MDGHETEEENLQKRYRSRNFTKYEKDVFYSVFNQYVGIIGDKNSSALTIREAWDKLVVEYNVQPNIYPRTRRQLQVLWRDEKFRAKKKEQKNKDRSPSKMTGGLDCEGESSTSTCEAVPSPSKPIATEGERHPSSLLTPLLTVIKREHEAYSAGEITPVLPLEPYPPPPAQETGPCSTLRSRSKQKKVHGKVIKQEESYSRSPSPERYGSGLDRVLPTPRRSAAALRQQLAKRQAQVRQRVFRRRRLLLVAEPPPEKSQEEWKQDRNGFLDGQTRHCQ